MSFLFLFFLFMSSLYFVGRLLVVFLFLFSAYGKITGFDATAGMMAKEGIPFASVALVLAILFEVVGSILLLVGKRFAGSGAAMLIIFTVLATYYFHDFWNFAGTPAFMDQVRNFLKNLSIVGGLVVLLYNYRYECPGLKLLGLVKDEKKKA